MMLIEKKLPKMPFQLQYIETLQYEIKDSLTIFRSFPFITHALHSFPTPSVFFTIWATLACRAFLINSKFHTLNQHIGVLSKKNYSNLGWHFTYTSLFSLYNMLGSIFLNINSCTYFPWHSTEDIISPVMTELELLHNADSSVREFLFADVCSFNNIMKELHTWWRIGCVNTPISHWIYWS